MVTLITGAASGLGWAMAQHWFKAGHSLMLADIDADALAARRTELGDEHRVHITAADVTQRSPAATTHPDVFRRVMAVDFQGPVELTQMALPEPVSRFGSLLWRIAPSLYLRAVRKKFAGDIPA